MNKSLRYLTVIFCLLGPALKAQDIQFSQFYANQVLLNPAFTGAAEGPRLALNARSQWSNIPGAYRTFAASYDQPVDFGQTRHGLGGTIFVDQAGAGALTKMNLMVNYAYRLLLSDKAALRLGLAVGFQYATIDFSQLVFPDELNRPSPYQSPDRLTSPNGTAIGSANRFNEHVTFGALYYRKNFWVGATFHNLTTPQERFIQNNRVTSDEARLPIRVAAYAGYMMPLDGGEGRIAISPAIMFRTQGPFSQIDLGTYLTMDPIVIGLWYRLGDAVIGLIGLRRGQFSIGYSYDYTLPRNNFTNAITGGSHEVSFIYEFERKKSVKRPKVKMSCPQF